MSFYAPDAVWDVSPMGIGTFEGRAAIRSFLELQHNRYWHRADGLALDVGAYAAALEYASGREAVTVGKPARDFFLAVMADIGLERARRAAPRSSLSRVPARSPCRQLGYRSSQPSSPKQAHAHHDRLVRCARSGWGAADPYARSSESCSSKITVKSVRSPA